MVVVHARELHNHVLEGNGAVVRITVGVPVRLARAHVAQVAVPLLAVNKARVVELRAVPPFDVDAGGAVAIGRIVGRRDVTVRHKAAHRGDVCIHIIRGFRARAAGKVALEVRAACNAAEGNALQIRAKPLDFRLHVAPFHLLLTVE